MLEQILTQLQYEGDTWKRLLIFMADENIYLKNRLSAVLKGGFDKDLLMMAESFQNNFVREDDLINLLRSDIAEFDKLLTRHLFEDGAGNRNIKLKLKSIRANMTIAENQFSKLKHEFNSYLLENVFME